MRASKLGWVVLLVTGSVLYGCGPMTRFDESKGMVPPSRVVLRKLTEHPGLTYFLYLPQKRAPNAKVLIVVHGISRRAREEIRHFTRLSEKYGVVLVAPRFTRDRFPDYQRLGQSGKGERPDLVLNDILKQVHATTGADVTKLYLFGYSGGGQFVHRYAMAYPKKTAAVAIGAAGWYTFPDPKVPFPRGLKHKNTLGDIRFKPCEFLKVPMAVFVGDRDYRRDASLNKSYKIDNQQGYTRIERASRWIDAMRAAAKAYHVPAHYEFRVMPHVGHSFLHSIKRGKMAPYVFKFLFAQQNGSQTSPQTYPLQKQSPQLKIVPVEMKDNDGCGDEFQKTQCAPPPSECC